MNKAKENLNNKIYEYYNVNKMTVKQAIHVFEMGFEFACNDGHIKVKRSDI